MQLSAQYRGGDRFDLEIRGHRLIVDQPRADGGDDRGPTPTELFVAGLAACAGFYAERFLRRHDLPAAALRVEASAEMSTDRPARVASITIRLDGLDGVPARRLDALRAVVEHCTVHNSIRQAPEVRLELGPVRALSRG
jgi:uncharacterized OsmC-like protein